MALTLRPKLTDLTSGATIGLTGVAVAGVSPGHTGESATLTVARPMASGDELAVTVSRVHNPGRGRRALEGMPTSRARAV
jgi:hypothetical protein